MKKLLLFFGIALALAVALFLFVTGRVHAQEVPGIAAPAPEAWVQFGIVGRHVPSGGDVPDLLLPSQASARETLYQYSGTNASVSERWVQVFKANTAPANGTAPELEIAVPGGSSFCSFMYPIQSLAATGFVIACSTTQGSLTLTNTNDCFIAATISP